MAGLLRSTKNLGGSFGGICRETVLVPIGQGARAMATAGRVLFDTAFLAGATSRNRPVRGRRGSAAAYPAS